MNAPLVFDSPAWTEAPALAPKFGKLYRLRNGASVILWKKHPLGFLCGDYVNPSCEERYTCQDDGWYAPESGVRPHSLDIVAEVAS